MPTLNWIGKEAVVNHHRQVPYYLLRCDNSLSCGDPDSGNLLVEGDNLLALKALLPYYAGQVKCIYIDPPYNTGNENWVYNDNVNSPEMRKWLGKVVGKEGEDLTRNDKWLCMMYPRLSLLKDFLKEDGVIFISIDSNEIHRIRFLLDDIFGPKNFVEQFIWRSRLGKGGTANQTATIHEYILCYARRIEKAVFARDSKVSNGKLERLRQWGQGDRREDRPTMFYPIIAPDGKELLPIKPDGTEGRWRVVKKRMKFLLDNNQVEFIKQGDGRIEAYRVIPKGHITYSAIDSIIDNKIVGTTADGSKILKNILGESVFDYPKPVNLVKYLINLLCCKDDIIMDSFAGSGTTGHAVLKMNQEDGGRRKFILIEMVKDVCNKITCNRLKKVAEGYDCEQNGKTVKEEGLGGGFRYCKLDRPLFDETGKISELVKFGDLAAHVFFTETGRPIPKRANGENPFLGSANGTGYYLLFNGILGDKTPEGGNVLTGKVLANLPKHNGAKVIFGEGCRLGDARLRREQITFKQLPYEIKVS